MYLYLPVRPLFFLPQQAGAAVKKATETLVKAAQDSQDNVTEEEAKINVRRLCVGTCCHFNSIIAHSFSRSFSPSPSCPFCLLFAV